MSREIEISDAIDRLAENLVRFKGDVLKLLHQSKRAAEEMDRSSELHQTVELREAIKTVEGWY